MSEPRCPHVVSLITPHSLHNRPPLLVALHGNGMAVGGLQGQAHSSFTGIRRSMVERRTRTGCSEIMTFEPASSPSLIITTTILIVVIIIIIVENGIGKYRDDCMYWRRMYVHSNAAAAARGELLHPNAISQSSNNMHRNRV